MFWYDKDMERVMQHKKREILKELEEAKCRILKELSGVDKITLTRLREILADYNHIDFNINEKIEKFLLQGETVLSDAEKIAKFFEAEIKRVNDLKSAIDNLSTYVTPEMYGAIGDGESDDTNALIDTINSGFPIYMGNKVYAFNDLLVFNDLNNVFIFGKNATLKYNGDKPSSDVGNTAVITFNNCKNLSFKNITVDANNTWTERPINTEEGYNEYLTKRTLTYDALKFVNCEKFNVDNYTGVNSKTGIFVSGCVNFTISNSRSLQTMADGVLITGASKYGLVENHFCYQCNDDQFSADGFREEKENNPSYITFKDCKSAECFGAVVCLEGSNYTKAVRCSGETKYSGFKLGNLRHSNIVAYGSNQSLINCECVLNEKIEYGSGHAIFLISTTSDNRCANINIEGCSYKYLGTNKVELFVQYGDNITIKNCHFENVTLVAHKCVKLILNNNTIISQDRCVITAEGVIVSDNIIRNKKLFSSRGNGAIVFSGSNDITLKGNVLKENENDVNASIYNENEATKFNLYEAFDTPTLNNMREVIYHGIYISNSIPREGIFKSGQAYYRKDTNEFCVIA